MTLYLSMYFIIIHSSNFEYSLSVNILLYKGKNKVCRIFICYCELKLKTDKRPIKKLRMYVQVQW